MNNLKIRQKFLILGLITIMALFLLAFLSFKINKDSYDNSNSVVKNFKKAQNIQIFYIEKLFTLREITLSLVISPNEDFKEKFNKKIMPIINKLNTNFSNNTEVDHKAWYKYRTLVLKTREYSLKDFDEGAFMNTSTLERESFYTLIDELKTVQNIMLSNSENKLSHLERSLELNNLYIVLWIIFIGLLGVILDMTIIMKIIKQIENVEVGLKNFFKYLANPIDYKEALHIEIKSNDELGLMSRAINKKVEVIRENLNYDYILIQEATITLDHLKEGKFGSRLVKEASSKELNSLKNVMNEMIENLERKILEEIHQRTNQEKLMLQQSKLAAMGEMIGNIAHQWRQPISEINAVLMEIETITKYSELEKSHLLDSIYTCNRITEHMSTTINDFQNFFKPTKQKDDFSVLEASKKALSIINASLKNNNIKLTFNIKDDNIIYGYSNEFSHAILNILSNAKDVLISRKILNPEIILSLKTGKKFTVIHVEDNAGGIKTDNIDLIFEPYFTTKVATRGTGIGLYMTKMIIENNMQGYVNVKNSQKGAMFTIKVK